MTQFTAGVAVPYRYSSSLMICQFIIASHSQIIQNVKLCALIIKNSYSVRTISIEQILVSVDGKNEPFRNQSIKTINYKD